MGFRVRNMETRRVVPGIPTPFLIEQGGGEAYFVPSESGRFDGVWYARAKGYESPDGAYSRVRIEHTEDWRVDLNVTLSNERETVEPYDDYFIVEAADEREAQDLALAKAREDIERSSGDEYASDIRIVGTRRGVSI